MKKLIKTTNVFIVCICVLFGCMSTPIIAYAEEGNTVEPRMTYISSYTTELSITDTGLATVTGMVRGKAGVTSTYVKCTLQLSVGGGWADVKTWEASSGGIGATVAETYQLSSRGTYRVYMECSANTESKTLTSAYRTY